MTAIASVHQLSWTLTLFGDYINKNTIEAFNTQKLLDVN